jgi:hypothetical protein
MRFGAALAALHDYKEPAALPPSSSAHRVVFPQHTLTHFVTPASIDAPATTLPAARPRPPLRRCDVPRVYPLAPRASPGPLQEIADAGCLALG